MGMYEKFTPVIQLDEITSAEELMLEELVGLSNSTPLEFLQKIGGSIVNTTMTINSGDVVGPAGASNDAIARFDGTTGKLIQNSVVTIADSTGNMANVGTLNTHTIPAGTDTFALIAATQSLTNKTISLGSNTVTGTIAQFNTAVSDADFATLAGTETLSNKTLTAPKFVDLGYIADANGNEMVVFDTVGSAIEYITIKNAALEDNCVISATDGLTLAPTMGLDITGTYFAVDVTGSVTIDGPDCALRSDAGNTLVEASGVIGFQTGASTQYGLFNFDAIAATNKTFTFPNATGTIVLNDNTATLTNKTIALGSNTISGTIAQFNTAVSDADLATLAGSETLTNKRVTPRVVSPADATSTTPNTDSADMTYQINTAAGGTHTVNADAGTPTNGQKWIYKIKTTNVQTFAWNALYVGGSTVALPTTTSGSSNIDYIGFIYDAVDTKWHCVSVAANY